VKSQNIFVSKQTKFYNFKKPRVKLKNQVILICDHSDQVSEPDKLEIIIKMFKKFLQIGMTC